MISTTSTTVECNSCKNTLTTDDVFSNCPICNAELTEGDIGNCWTCAVKCDTCPFCNGSAELSECDTGNCCWIYAVKCTKCDVSGPEVHVTSTKPEKDHIAGMKKAVDLWNTRY